VRPLILEDADGKSEWLVPMLSDPSRQCCYETFLDWFERLMRDEVELPCTPHNYRHGQASLLYHAHPEHLDTIAQRLGNTPNTVLKHYAWIHEELSMIEGQKLLTDLIQGSVQ
jgi:integrase